jgi:hypothetical protein
MATISGPSWLADIFAVVMIFASIFSLGRIFTFWLWSRPVRRSVEAMHALMGVAMAGMLVPGLDPIPKPAYVLAFGGLLVVSLRRCRQIVAHPELVGLDEGRVHLLPRCVTHVVMCAAMLYMYLAVATTTTLEKTGAMGMNGGNNVGADYVGLPLLFLAVLLVSGVWELDGVQPFGPERTLQRGPKQVIALTAPGTRPECPAPGLNTLSHIAMCITMAYMLVLML